MKLLGKYKSGLERMKFEEFLGSARSVGETLDSLG